MRIRIAAIGKTAVMVHPATLVTVGASLFNGQGLFTGCAVASVLLHEGAHAIVAALMGHPPSEMELTPLGALMRMDDETAIPLVKRIPVILAGPVMSLLIAFLSVLISRREAFPLEVGRALFLSNLALVLVNLLPALPLDGGRLLMALLGRIISPKAAAKTMKVLGTIIGLICIGVNLWWLMRIGGGISLACAGCFLIYSASGGTAPRALIMLREYMARKDRFSCSGPVSCALVAVNETQTALDMMHRLKPGKYTIFLILQQLTAKILGVLDEASVVSICLDQPGMCAREMIGFIQKKESKKGSDSG